MLGAWCPPLLFSMPSLWHWQNTQYAPVQGQSFSTLNPNSSGMVTDDCSSGRHGAESVAGSAALAAPRRRPAPATTGSKGSCGEVSSAVRQPHHTSSEDTLSYEPSVSETGDVEPEELPDGQIRVPVVVGTTKGVYLVQVGGCGRSKCESHGGT